MKQYHHIMQMYILSWLPPHSQLAVFRTKMHVRYAHVRSVWSSTGEQLAMPLSKAKRHQRLRVLCFLLQPKTVTTNWKDADERFKRAPGLDAVGT